MLGETVNIGVEGCCHHPVDMPAYTTRMHLQAHAEVCAHIDRRTTSTKLSI